jgi:hypothetical protein
MIIDLINLVALLALKSKQTDAVSLGNISIVPFPIPSHETRLL